MAHSQALTDAGERAEAAKVERYILKALETTAKLVGQLIQRTEHRTVNGVLPDLS